MMTPRRDGGKSHDAEMRRNEFNRNPAGTGDKRFAPADSPGASSSRSRSTKSGAAHHQSKSSGRGGGAGPSGASSRYSDHEPGPAENGRGPASK